MPRKKHAIFQHLSKLYRAYRKKNIKRVFELLFRIAHFHSTNGSNFLFNTLGDSENKIKSLSGPIRKCFSWLEQTPLSYFCQGKNMRFFSIYQSSTGTIEKKLLNEFFKFGFQIAQNYSTNGSDFLFNTLGNSENKIKSLSGPNRKCLSYLEQAPLSYFFQGKNMQFFSIYQSSTGHIEKKKH